MASRSEKSSAASLREQAEQLWLKLECCQRKEDEIDVIEAFARAQRAEALREAERAIVETCSMCDGQGWTVGIGTDYGHACDGTEESCSQNCPVPVPVQVQEQCEYCGRPVAAVAALRAAGQETP
jgi:hypothetical protein